MKIILGDNQFFGINHHDLNKANKDKSKFADEKSIVNFIISSLNAGLDGFMINSNQMGYNIECTNVSKNGKHFAEYKLIQ